MEEKVVRSKTPAVLFLLIFSLAVLSASIPTVASAQIGIPSTTSTPEQTSTEPQLTFQTPSVGAFNGSAKLDKVTPGALKISILDAIDRGIRHNLGLLLS